MLLISPCKPILVANIRQNKKEGKKEIQHKFSSCLVVYKQKSNMAAHNDSNFDYILSFDISHLRGKW